MNRLVSVIVPCYNQAQYLDECLQSVFDQTYQDWECIIVDDGSPDNTEVVASVWCNKDTRFKYLKKENGGLSSSRNAGIKLSIGEYLLPLDADDMIKPAFISSVIDHICNSDDIKAVSTNGECFGDFAGFVINPGGTLFDLFNRNIAPCTSVFRRLDYDKVGGFDELMKKGYEDWEFWLRLLKNGGRIEILPEHLFMYRVKKESMFQEARKFHLDIYNYILNKHKEIINDMAIQIILEKEKYASEINSIRYDLEKIIRIYERRRLLKYGNMIVSKLNYFKKLFS